MKKQVSIIVFALISLTASAQVSKTVNVSTPGTLSTLASSYLVIVTDLTVTGNIDARDVATMRDYMPRLTVLDISSVSIQAYTGVVGIYPTTTYPANEMPSNSFYKFSAIGGEIPLTSISLPASLTSIGNSAFFGCLYLAGSLNLPNSITTIGSQAFQSCFGITSLTLPTSLISIGSSAFSQCSGITSLTLPVSLKSISSYAFAYCSGITSLTLPTTLTHIGASAFESCTGLTSLALPNALSSIDQCAFFNCSGITGFLALPTSLSNIGIYAFYDCSAITDFIVSEANLNYSSLNGVLFNKSKTLIIQYPKRRQGPYIVPNSVTSIGSSAFFECSGITSISLPTSLISIQTEAFESCTGITTLTLPESLTSIGYKTFAGCTSIKSIYCLNPVPPTLDGYCFSNTSSVSDVFVPTDAAVIAYKASIWCDNFPGSIIKKGSPSAVSDLSFNSIKVYATASGINVEGLDVGQRITLYTLNGIQLQSLKSEGMPIVLAALPNAVYLIKTGSRTFKVIL